MKLATIRYEGREQAALLTSKGVVPLSLLNERTGSDWETDLLGLLQAGRLDALRSAYEAAGEELERSLPDLFVDAARVRFTALTRRPGKIIGIGMNYLEKAIELSGRPPENEPVIFLKPDSALIGPEEDIVLPEGAGAISAEAELAIVIGRVCRRVDEEDALSFAAGFATSLDMTAKDIHARNPRFMQRAKSFDTFVSLGSVLATPDEYADLSEISVETVWNGEVVHRNQVNRMIFSPAYLISFLSRIMTLNPGDVILTGTPGSVAINPGDRAACSIAGLPPLANPVSAHS
ncbi:fumarylacetoacetate hydrolase [Saccharibacillus sp. O23]|uniref:fumarylacetoacetate hydrolase family protein n=1 Tax=Saccharibacillus sp. O23 TaxID=2009338 RepID=UPI000B4E0D99|nr:fumarylacetoacetate hydrolase family protein [Saccharibacillus sp. O23]OWR31394.1 fumarylacetoacetate hydrolase [Saccharibacillus sp. O23]